MKIIWRTLFHQLLVNIWKNITAYPETTYCVNKFVNLIAGIYCMWTIKSLKCACFWSKLQDSSFTHFPFIIFLIKKALFIAGQFTKYSESSQFATVSTRVCMRSLSPVKKCVNLMFSGVKKMNLFSANWMKMI